MNRSFDGARRAGVPIRGVSLLLLGTFLLQGCYSVRPLEAGGPQPGTRLVASLTPDGSQQMASQLGPRVVAVEGVLDEATNSQLSLRVVRTEGANQVSTFWNEEPVTIPRPAISQLRMRKLDRPRSYLVAGLIVGGSVLLAALSSSILSGDSGGDPNPPPAN